MLAAQEVSPMRGGKIAAVSALALLAVAFRRAVARGFVAVTGSTVRSERR
jgi:hypothetical protein